MTDPTGLHLFYAVCVLCAPLFLTVAILWRMGDE